MRLVIVGAGWVGLVSGTCFAEMGHQVTCLDIDRKKINALQSGLVSIYEPGLEELIKRNLHAGRLFFTADSALALSTAEICIIAVDTPSQANGGADMSQVESAARSIGRHLNQDSIIAIKSTVPVGTSQRVFSWIEAELHARGAAISFDVVSNPEFLKEGNAVQDFMKPDRVIIGAAHSHAAAVMKTLYSPFMLNHERLLIMDPASAELSKYAANAMLATRISFMNELAAFCEAVSADVGMIRKAIGMDERIGNQFLYSGAGYGGSCLPKDVRALLAQAQEEECPLELLHAVHRVNQRQKQLMIQKIAYYFESRGGVAGKIIGILGLSFKPDTNDMREAPSIPLIDYLLKEGARLQLFDPAAIESARVLLGENRPEIVWCSNEKEAAKNAHALVLMTEWKQFRFLPFSTFLADMQGCAFFDGRNQYHPKEMAGYGFDYISIGRPAAHHNPREKVAPALARIANG